MFLTFLRLSGSKIYQVLLALFKIYKDSNFYQHYKFLIALTSKTVSKNDNYLVGQKLIYRRSLSYNCELDL